MVENQRLCLGHRVQVVGLEITLLGSHRFEQEFDQRGLFRLGNIDKAALEIAGIRAIVGRQAHAGQGHTGAAAARHVDHGVQVVAHLRQRQAAQAVVGAQRDDDDGRFVVLERRIQSRTAAGRGFTRNRQVGDAIIEPLVAQALAEQGRPGLLRPDAITGGQRIAHHQDGLGGMSRQR